MKIVIKIGTNVLLGKHSSPDNEHANLLDKSIVIHIAEQIAALYKEGHTAIIITSGAVACGYSISHTHTISRAAHAALGQAYLMEQYAKVFSEHNRTIAQILLSPNAFQDRERYKKLKTTLEDLEKVQALPIINENDVTTTKSSFWDNDSLAGMIASLCQADMLIFLTDIDGLYTASPHKNPSAQLVKTVDNVGLSIQKMGTKETASLGRGGMFSKLKAAKLATTCGIETYIVNGFKRNCITQITHGNNIGTHFKANTKTALNDRKKWLLIGSVSKNKIVVDEGAKGALKNRKSLLAVGVVRISGTFEKGDFINIADKSGEIFAFGIVNYDSAELIKLKMIELNQEYIKKHYPKEVIHANNVTLLA